MNLHLWRRFGERYPDVRFAITILPLIILLIAANNQRQNEQKKRSDAQFRETLRVTDQKFRQALRISDDKHRQALHSQAVLFAYSINKSTCVLRVISKQQIDRLETTKTQDYKAAEGFWARILENQVPIPADFKCSTLPKKPPKGTP